MTLPFYQDTPTRPISPFTELAAYEALWDQEGASYKALSARFKSYPGSRPSDFVDSEKIDRMEKVMDSYFKAMRRHYELNIVIKGTWDYPDKLLDAKDQVELLYYAGKLDLLGSRAVSVVGTRNPTPDGIKRTRQLVKKLIEDDFTIISGLAKGIDTAAHKTAIENGGRTIAVIGTPLNKFYPPENEQLQKDIASKYLLISQVPFHRYSQQGIKGNRLFFPERNKTMSALSEATIIVEAGETSGTLVQARAALEQGRKLFIFDSCFLNKEITWPEKFQQKGALRIKNYDELREALEVNKK